MDDQLTDEDLRRLSAFVEAAMGLTFPPPRWPDLRRGIAGAASQLGFKSNVECARKILAGPATKGQIEALASHLTVGETYFFREPRAFEILKEHIIPALIEARRNNGRSLRIWSAACCTGEEAYSIAILLHQIIGELKDWNIKILATDINPRFLRKATRGIFGQWSFRDAPPWLKQKYFRSISEGQFEILPEIRRMVTFAPLNLAEDVYPSLTTETNAMDVIFCRNVLMYFVPLQARRVIERLHLSQTVGGWLLVGPSELPQASCSPYAAVNFQGGILYQKDGAATLRLKIPSPQDVLEVHVDVLQAGWNEGDPAKRDQHKKAAASTKQAAVESEEPAALQLQTRSLANQGRLAEALDCCNRWIAVDRLNSSGHYLRGVILQEQGKTDHAIRSLRGALYLDPDFVLAHFAMGRIARDRGDHADANKHLHNAEILLRRFPPDEVLPESEGVTAGRFRQIVDSLIEMEAAA